LRQKCIRTYIIYRNYRLPKNPIVFENRNIESLILLVQNSILEVSLLLIAILTSSRLLELFARGRQIRDENELGSTVTVVITK